MQTRPVIFIVTSVLLVPFLYAVPYIPGVCAEPKDENWGSTCTHDVTFEKKTCCWWKQDPETNISTYTCQTCDNFGNNCGPVFLKPSSGTTGKPEGGVLQDPAGPTGKPQGGPLGGGVLQDPSTDSAPKVPGKGGFSLGPNLKFSQSNTTSSNDSSTTRTGIEYNTEGQERSYEDKTEDKESGTTKEDDSEQPDEDN